MNHFISQKFPESAPAFVSRSCRLAGKYDILHVFSASYYSYMLSAMPAILAGKLFGTKTILNYRSGIELDRL